MVRTPSLHEVRPVDVLHFEINDTSVFPPRLCIGRVPRHIRPLHDAMRQNALAGPRFAEDGDSTEQLGHWYIRVTAALIHTDKDAAMCQRFRRGMQLLTFRFPLSGRGDDGDDDGWGEQQGGTCGAIPIDTGLIAFHPSLVLLSESSAVRVRFTHQ